MGNLRIDTFPMISTGILDSTQNGIAAQGFFIKMENIYTYQARLYEFSYKRVELNSECCAHCVSKYDTQ
ncbi:MAG TPA: hypothetical protein PKH05_12350, partial [Nitrospira sp.]|nr:hypothetical protein [Nitrospira sp.]